MPPAKQPSLVELTKKAIADTQRLAKAQLELTKKELNSTGERIGRGGAFGVVALLLAFFGTLFLFVTLALVLVQVGLPPWAGFLIIAALLIIGTIAMAMLARREFQQISGPTLAVEEFEKTKAAFSTPPVDEL